MESRVSDCAARHARGFNCAQAIACTYADLVGRRREDHVRRHRGRALAWAACRAPAAHSPRRVICGLANSCADLEAPTSKAATYKVSRELVRRFAEVSGATRCADLKGVETGQVLCSCPQCIENAARILEDVVFADAE